MLLHVYRVRLRATGPLTFPTFPGPALRGALGDDRAVYEALLRPGVDLPQKRFADPPRPLLLRPRFGAGTYAAGSALEVEVTLVGSAGRFFPQLLRALVRLGEAGVGAGRHGGGEAGRFVVERVDAVGPEGDAAVVTPDGFFTPARAPWRFPGDFARPAGEAPSGGFTLELASPTYVRRRDEPRGSLAFRDLLDDLLKRVSLFGQAYGDGPVYARDEERALLAAAGEVEARDAAARYVEVPRFSRRQGSAMTFEGWMGWVAYRGDPSPWRPLLRAARFLHAGKHTTFGLGEVRFSG